MMTFEETLISFLVALAAGALIGLERQQDTSVEQRLRIGGVRTFPLIALAGALSMFISQALGIWVLFGSLLILGSFLAVSYFEESRRTDRTGLTTPVAALITFLLGALALIPNLGMDTTHRYLLLISSAAVVMALLSFKERLHQLVARVSDDDIYATAKFVILALVVLPLLPNRTFGPFSVLNPFSIGLMVVLIAGISFLGYLCTRFLDPGKGMATTGILGGLVSSTAVTLSVSSQVRRNPHLAITGSMAILGASSAMFARMLVIVGLLEPGLVPALLAPLGAMSLTGFGTVLFLYGKSRRPSSNATEIPHRNPFELRSALTFGLLYAAVLFIAKAAQTFLGEAGLYGSSILAGTTDVDAITLSLVQFFKEGLSPWTTATALTLAAITNTIVKALIVLWSGGKPLARFVVPNMAIILGMGGGIILLFRFMQY
ncbi:MAG: MgtC/SapB family protein [Nitrospirales bacterium]